MAVDSITMKTCTSCAAELPLTSFYLSRKGQTTGGQCKACRSAKVQEVKRQAVADPAEAQRRRLWRKEHKRKVRAAKGCTPRAEIAAATEARRKAKEAEREAMRIARTAQHDAHVKRWRSVVRDRERFRKKMLDPAFREKQRQRRSRYRAKVEKKAVIAAHAMVYNKRPDRRIHSRLQKHIREALAGTKNRRSWQSLVGYTREELMRHLERQFVKGMGWHNMDQWHIDHIVPRSSFVCRSAECPEFRACWALTNLRPLWADANVSKGARRTHLL